MTVRSKGGAVPYVRVEGAQVGDELRCRQRRSIQAFAALMAHPRETVPFTMRRALTHVVVQ